MNITFEDLDRLSSKEYLGRPVFLQARIIHAIAEDMMPALTPDHVDQLVDMFEEPQYQRSAFCNLYMQSMLMVVTYHFDSREKHLTNMRKFFTQLANFAEVHNRLDRLLFGQE